MCPLIKKPTECLFQNTLPSLSNTYLRFWSLNPLSANATRWSNTFKQFVDNLPTNCLSVFDHFVILALKGLRENQKLSRKFEKLNRMFESSVKHSKSSATCLGCNTVHVVQSSHGNIQVKLQSNILTSSHWKLRNYMLAG